MSFWWCHSDGWLDLPFFCLFQQFLDRTSVFDYSLAILVACFSYLVFLMSVLCYCCLLSCILCLVQVTHFLLWLQLILVLLCYLLSTIRGVGSLCLFFACLFYDVYPSLIQMFRKTYDAFLYPAINISDVIFSRYPHSWIAISFLLIQFFFSSSVLLYMSDSGSISFIENLIWAVLFLYEYVMLFWDNRTTFAWLHLCSVSIVIGLYYAP